MKRGLFITFEGGEGSGKSSHIRSLKDFLEGEGRECVITREPGGTAISEKIRGLLLHEKAGEAMDALTELLLFSAARAQHVKELILPALEAGKTVVSDRFFDSSTAYQGAARSLDMGLVEELNGIASCGLKPDITVLLDIPVEVGLARAKGRDGGEADRMGSQKLEFYKAVREGFLRLADENPDRFLVVDSSGERSAVFAKILECVKQRLKA